MPEWWPLRGRDGDHPDECLLTVLALDADGDAAAARHVVSCESCAARLQVLTTALADERTAALADADRWFTPARLERQRLSILRHIAPTRSRARVLAFPGRARGLPGARGVGRRWVAAAAVAGLLLGGVAGRFVEPLARQRDARNSVALGEATSFHAVTLESANDEAFLVELDAAVGQPRLEPLTPLDALLPPIQEGAQ